MNKRNFNQDERSPKEKAIEIVPIIIAAILLVIAMSLKEFSVLKIVLLVAAALIGVGMYLFVLVRELIQRKRNKK